MEKYPTFMNQKNIILFTTSINIVHTFPLFVAFQFTYKFNAAPIRTPVCLCVKLTLKFVFDCKWLRIAKSIWIKGKWDMKIYISKFQTSLRGNGVQVSMVWHEDRQWFRRESLCSTDFLKGCQDFNGKE
jgi:hypothetical protein